MYFANSVAVLAGALWHQPRPMVSEKIRAPQQRDFHFASGEAAIVLAIFNNGVLCQLNPAQHSTQQKL